MIWIWNFGIWKTKEVHISRVQQNLFSRKCVDIHFFKEEKCWCLIMYASVPELEEEQNKSKVELR